MDHEINARLNAWLARTDEFDQLPKIKADLPYNGPYWGCIMVGGCQGSGKSVLARGLAREIGAFVIQSDAVRKHLWGIPVTEKLPVEAYSKEHALKTVNGIIERAGKVLDHGYPVIIDQTFSALATRNQVQYAMTDKAAGHVLGLWCDVSHEVAVSRILARQNDLSDYDAAAMAYSPLHTHPNIQPDPYYWQVLDANSTPEDILVRALHVVEKRIGPHAMVPQPAPEPALEAENTPTR